MNAVKMFEDSLSKGASKAALVFNGNKTYSFGDLRILISRYQNAMLAHGLKPGDKVLFMVDLSVDLYAGIIGALGLGVSVLMVQPWMSADKINSVVQTESPDCFICSKLGFLFGLRHRIVRRIRHWLPIQKIHFYAHGEIIVETVSPEAKGLIAFTTGTTGDPKGVNRPHQFLFDQLNAFRKHLIADPEGGPDLTLFAVFVLGNLASYKTSIVVPPNWNRRTVAKIDRNFNNISGITTAPAFLEKILDEGLFSSLKHVHVGGASTDCSLVERALKRGIDVTHVYGSSEAEPVTVCDGETALLRSRERGYHQILYLGKPVSEINIALEADQAWVNGPHVSKLYLNNEKANRLNKRVAENGEVWHAMGDRITADDGVLWYAGRSHQTFEDFCLEQKIYASLNSSDLFLKVENGKKFLIASSALNDIARKIEGVSSEIDEIVYTKIYRDPRHRSRIDRIKTLKGISLL